jgi:hypothetical protein
MILLAYHLGHLWIRVKEHNGERHLPTPYQYLLTMSLVNSPRPKAIFDSLRYVFTSRSKRKSLAPVFLLAFGSALLVVALTWSIKGLDLVLHDRITSTLLWSDALYPSFRSSVFMRPECMDPDVAHCPVANRTTDAQIGGLNQSDVFHVYPQMDLTNSSVGRLAFIAPAVISGNDSIAGAHTYAAGMICQAYRPSCLFQKGIPQSCGPDHSYGLVTYPVYNNSLNFPVFTSRAAMQIFLVHQGNATQDLNIILNGANTNPLNFASWGCFSNYAHIRSDNTLTAPFQSPFMSWTQWQLTKLCTITLCNTTIYDATYSAADGNFTIDVQSLQVANKSTTLALSGGAAVLTPIMPGINVTDGPANYYQDANNYMDEMLQVDLSSAGNVYGNSSDAFAATWAMSISARLLGWSGGTFELRAVDNTVHTRVAVSAISIDVASAYAFAILHFVLAGVIVLLGISCVFISKYAPSMNGSDLSEPARKGTDIRAAHAKLSDYSTPMAEVVNVRSADQGSSTSYHSTGLDTGDAEERSVERRVRLGLRTNADGVTELEFRG